MDVEHSMIVSSSSKGRPVPFKIVNNDDFSKWLLLFSDQNMLKRYGQMFVAPGSYLLVSDMGGPTLGSQQKFTGEDCAFWGSLQTVRDPWKDPFLRRKICMFGVVVVQINRRSSWKAYV